MAVSSVTGKETWIQFVEPVLAASTVKVKVDGKLGWYLQNGMNAITDEFAISVADIDGTQMKIAFKEDTGSVDFWREKIWRKIQEEEKDEQEEQEEDAVEYEYEDEAENFGNR